MSSIGSELPRMVARVARLLPIYGATGSIGAIDEILPAIDRAAEAMATQDALAYLRSFEELKAVLA